MAGLEVVAGRHVAVDERTFSQHSLLSDARGAAVSVVTKANRHVGFNTRTFPHNGIVEASFFLKRGLVR